LYGKGSQLTAVPHIAHERAYTLSVRGSPFEFAARDEKRPTAKEFLNFFSIMVCALSDAGPSSLIQNESRDCLKPALPEVVFFSKFICKVVWLFVI
jgi:hypothetical protein